MPVHFHFFQRPMPTPKPGKSVTLQSSSGSGLPVAMDSSCRARVYAPKIMSLVPLLILSAVATGPPGLRTITATIEVKICFWNLVSTDMKRINGFTAHYPFIR